MYLAKNYFFLYLNQDPDADYVLLEPLNLKTTFCTALGIFYCNILRYRVPLGKQSLWMYNLILSFYLWIPNILENKEWQCCSDLDWNPTLGRSFHFQLCDYVAYTKFQFRPDRNLRQRCTGAQWNEISMADHHRVNIFGKLSLILCKTTVYWSLSCRII